MPQIDVYQLDAFAERPFGGNPAAVCPLESWLDDAVMQAIAAENNLSETAFFVPEGKAFRLRWFTPVLEVNLCGHATLAAAQVVFDRIAPDADQITFLSLSGPLQVVRSGPEITMDFPALPPQDEAPPAALIEALGGKPQASYKIRQVHGSPYVMCVFGREAEVAALAPDFTGLKANVIATAPGDQVDFVSRFFAPLSGILEDPVTGSAHCSLTPYWAGRLGKSALRARQISQRGGALNCRLEGDRVFISGRCAYFMEGKIRL